MTQGTVRHSRVPVCFPRPAVTLGPARTAGAACGPRAPHPALPWRGSVTSIPTLVGGGFLAPHRCRQTDARLPPKSSSMGTRARGGRSATRVGRAGDRRAPWPCRGPRRTPHRHLASQPVLLRNRLGDGPTLLGDRLAPRPGQGPECPRVAFSYVTRGCGGAAVALITHTRRPRCSRCSPPPAHTPGDRGTGRIKFALVPK